MSMIIKVWEPNQEIIIKFKGLMDLEGLYKLIHDWYESRKFEYHETVFKDKAKPAGGEEEIRIKAFRNDTELMRVWINLYVHTFELKKVEVIKEGKKKLMENGRFRITIRVEFELDYENNWEKSKFSKVLFQFYVKNIILRKIQTYGDKIEYEAHGLHEAIKQWLGMEAKGNQFADMW